MGEAVEVSIEVTRTEGEGYQILIQPWSVTVYRDDSSPSIAWRSNHPISIRFQGPTPFRNVRPFSVEEGQECHALEATGLFAHAGLGVYPYTIDIFLAEAGRRISIDPDYIVDERY